MELFAEGEDEEFVGALVQQYRPVRLIGAGAFSTVFEGESTTGQPVAIKVVDKAKVSRGMRREAEILALLRHPCVLAY